MSEIVPALEEHIDYIYNIELEAFDDSWTKNMIYYGVYDVNTDLLVLLEDKELIGYLFISEIMGEASIDNIAIKKEFRSKGYSKVIMDYVIEHYGNMPITLEVRVGNEPAIELYKKYDFKIEGIRKDYYGKGIDAHIMWRR